MCEGSVTRRCTGTASPVPRPTAGPVRVSGSSAIRSSIRCFGTYLYVAMSIENGQFVSVSATQHAFIVIL